jgi:competence protein ComEC
MTRTAIGALTVAFIGCGGAAPPASPPPVATQPAPVPAVAAAPTTPKAALPAAPAEPAPPVREKPAAGAFVVHVVDVGSGLGIFVEGHDFSLVYDAGSKDDTAVGDANRFVAYLKAVRPDLGSIDHVILGHPHPEHLDLLGDVLSRYDVKEFWESGVPNAECAYQAIIKTIKERNVTYHSAMQAAGVRRIGFQKPCEGFASGYSIKHAERIETGMRVRIGEGATMTFSYAASKPMLNPDDNTLVVRLDLGKSRVLIMGDAGAGGRADPSSAPKRGSVEGELLRTKSDIKSDVLVVGDHGSTASSRQALVDVIHPKVSVISSGPAEWDGVKLPETPVVAMLEKRGSLFRTDRDDATCGAKSAKVGPDADGKPGGCDNVRIVLEDGSPPKAAYWTPKD